MVNKKEYNHIYILNIRIDYTIAKNVILAKARIQMWPDYSGKLPYFSLLNDETVYYFVRDIGKSN